MIPTEFQYRRANSLDDAISLLSETDGKLLAGGHSIIPLMKLRLSEPGTLIDIARLPELKGIRESDGMIEIGAGTTHYEIETSDLLRQRAPVVAECAHEIGDPQVRHRGTIGGSLAHSDPAADYPAVMVALDAEIHLKGKGGWRSVRAADFFQDLFTVDMAPDEIIVSVKFEPTQQAAYSKLHQRASHYAIVGVCAVLQMNNGVCQSARLGLTGAGSHAVRMPEAEAALVGTPLDAATISAAADLAAASVEDVNADLHAGEDYRRHMIGVFARRAIEVAASR
jgi:aerobic carbon-monoxide dehydrogenase medium subunit